MPKLLAPRQGLPKALLLFLTFLLLNGLSLFAQTAGTIKGVVKDQSGNPIPGVTVEVKGTDKGTTTNGNGAFSIKASASATLVFSSVGFAHQEVKVDGQVDVTVTLSTTDTHLNDVVVIGYGTQRRKDITSAISTIDVKDEASRPVVSTSEILEGKAPGVQVVQPSGAPGSDFSIRVRGISSPNGSEPLYVIDGVVVENTTGLDPNSIVSISVLKDAAAAGIYGSAGSTKGVVLITTKSGVKGKTQTSVTGYTGVQQIAKKLDMLNGTQYLALMNDEYANAGMSLPNIPSSYNATNNWQDLVYHTAPQTGANATFSGGTDKGTWLLGLSLLNQDGIIRTSNYDRYAVTFKLDQKMNDWLSVGAHVNYSRSNNVGITDGASAQHGGTVLAALTTPPIVPVINSQGIYVPNFDGTANPIGNLYDNTNKKIANNVLGDVHGEVKLPFNLKYRTQFGVMMQNFDYNYFLNPFNNAYGISVQGQASNESQEIFRYDWDNTLSWSHSFGKSNIEAVVGSSLNDEKYYDNNQSGEGFATASVPTLNAASDNKNVSSDLTEWTNLSYFGRVLYSYADKYLFTGTFRRDGSSLVGIDNPWGNFPAFSVGWRVSNEDFMKNIRFIQDLKLRAGWGETGNLPPPNLTTYPSYTALNPGAPYPFGGTIEPGVTPSNPIGNTKLTWETGAQTNVGFDLTVLHSRLTFSFDYYNKLAKKLIFSETLPATSGNGDGQTLINLPGVDKNQGEEFALTGNIIKGRGFNWTSTVNLSFNKNEITGLDSTSTFYYGGIEFGGSGNSSYASIIKNGLPLGSFWGYVSQGVDPTTGNEKFKDLNGDGVIDADHDRTYLGHGAPSVVYSWINNFSYKHFGLDVLIDGVGGNKVFDATRVETEGMVGPGNASTAVLRRWEKPGDITDVPKAIYGDPGTIPNSSISTRFIESGAFLRAKALTLSYTLATEGMKRIGINGVRIYATGQNLFTITGYKGYNPEVNQQGQSTQAMGIDYGTYPQAKTYIFGLNVDL